MTFLRKLCRYLQRNGHGDWTADMQYALDDMASRQAIRNITMTKILDQCPTCARKAHKEALYYANFGSFENTPAGKL